MSTTPGLDALLELDGGPLGRLAAAALVNDEGRVEMSFKDLHRLPDPSINSTHDTEEFDVEDEERRMNVPPLNIVIQIVGSRSVVFKVVSLLSSPLCIDFGYSGDVQPYIALGLALNACGHRVRIATHPTFRSFVRSSGLEFFSIGGDPEDLMSYMVQNPGLLPGIKTIREGAIGRKRKMIREVCLPPSPIYFHVLIYMIFLSDAQRLLSFYIRGGPRA